MCRCGDEPRDLLYRLPLTDSKQRHEATRAVVQDLSIMAWWSDSGPLAASTMQVAIPESLAVDR